MSSNTFRKFEGYPPIGSLKPHNHCESGFLVLLFQEGPLFPSRDRSKILNPRQVYMILHFSKKVVFFFQWKRKRYQIINNHFVSGVRRTICLVSQHFHLGLLVLNQHLTKQVAHCTPLILVGTELFGAPVLPASFWVSTKRRPKT